MDENVAAENLAIITNQMTGVVADVNSVDSVQHTNNVIHPIEDPLLHQLSTSWKTTILRSLDSMRRIIK